MRGGRVRVAFYDDLVDDPSRFFRGIASFLLDATAPEHPIDSEPTNVSRGGALPEAVREALAEHFDDERRASAARFGGPAERWREPPGARASLS